MALLNCCVTGSLMTIVLLAQPNWLFLHLPLQETGAMAWHASTPTMAVAVIGYPVVLLVDKNVVGCLANPSAHFPLSLARLSSPTRTRRCRRHGQPSVRVPRHPRWQGACSKALSASAASITRFGLSRAPSHRGDRAHLQPPFAAVRRVDPRVSDSPGLVEPSTSFSVSRRSSSTSPYSFPCPVG